MAPVLPSLTAPTLYQQCHRPRFINPNHNVLLNCRSIRSLVYFRSSVFKISVDRNTSLSSLAALSSDRSDSQSSESLKLPLTFFRLAVSTILFLGCGFCFNVRLGSATPAQLPPSGTADSLSVQDKEDQIVQDVLDNKKHQKMGNRVDEELEAEFNEWKSKTYALTVPLNIVALRGSIPPSWIKDFIKTQGRRLKFVLKLQGTLESIFTDLSVAIAKGNSNTKPTSTLAADVVTIGDTWLELTIKKGLIEPIQGAEEQDWFKELDEKWKVYLRRNNEGKIDINGHIWAAPYRWGCMVIAYKKSKFEKHNLAPIEDWADLWQPELEGRISMIDSPREVVGTVLKYMGASYNTTNINVQVAGGREAVKRNLSSLRKQVRLFDNIHYLKAFGIGDTWVAVGWSSDVIPIAKRMSNVVVIVPKSGTSLWADLWAVPASSKIEAHQLGGRVRGPSPAIHQWIEFCLQPARALPFILETVPGSSPSAIQPASLQFPLEIKDNKVKLDSNLVFGTVPPDILERCEFLEPLSNSALSDYNWLITSMEVTNRGMIERMLGYISLGKKR